MGRCYNDIFVQLLIHVRFGLLFYGCEILLLRNR